MLRSRTKTGDTPRQLYELPNFFVEDQELSNKGSARLRRMGFSKMRTRMCFVMIVFLMVIGFDRLRGWRVREDGPVAVMSPRIEKTDTRIHQQIPEQGEADLSTAWNPTWQYPLVDRITLDQLQDLLMDSDDTSLNHSSNDQTQRQPRVTRLPEDLSRLRSADEILALTEVANDGICETPTHPRSCRFLYPIRIAEQESKARIHFFQLAQLARQLNRTLVLPKVGKSKIGACFKWNFQTYYDVDSLNSTVNDAPAVVDQDKFHVWLEGLERHVIPTTRLFAVGPSRLTATEERASDGNDRVRVYDVEPYDGWKKDIPGCLSKSRWLDDVYPTFVTVAQSTRGSSPLSASFVAALSDESLSNRSGYPVPATQILMLDWNLRYPVFQPSHSQQLRYSRTLMDLAGQLAPSTAYLVIHWRMETVNPNVLTDCAHALIDILVRLLHDESMSVGVTTVWLASDYPYPIARRTKTRPHPALEAKSGTFRDFEIRHEEAVQVLRKAFEEGGELERWKLTDISEATEGHAEDKELLNDTGVLGILDKLIGIHANLFVSGSNRCSRQSSFTTQIVDMRMNTRGREALLSGNIVDTFG